jgi:hypothetical protein
MERIDTEANRQDATSTLIDLEKKFWQSMADGRTDVALALLCKPSMMASEHPEMKFDHAAYRRMAEQGSQVVKSFQLSDVDVDVEFPDATSAIVSDSVRQVVGPRAQGGSTEQEMNDTSTWIKTGQAWRCALHTESPVARR